MLIEVDAPATPGLVHRITYEYDDLARLSAVEHMGNRTTYGYDLSSVVIMKVLPV